MDKKPLNCVSQDGTSAGMRSLQTSIVIKLRQVYGTDFNLSWVPVQPEKGSTVKTESLLANLFGSLSDQSASLICVEFSVDR